MSSVAMTQKVCLFFCSLTFYLSLLLEWPIHFFIVEFLRADIPAPQGTPRWPTSSSWLKDYMVGRIPFPLPCVCTQASSLRLPIFGHPQTYMRGISSRQRRYLIYVTTWPHKTMVCTWKTAAILYKCPTTKHTLTVAGPGNDILFTWNFWLSTASQCFSHCSYMRPQLSRGLPSAHRSLFTSHMVTLSRHPDFSGSDHLMGASTVG